MISTFRLYSELLIQRGSSDRQICSSAKIGINVELYRIVALYYNSHGMSNYFYYFGNIF